MQAICLRHMGTDLDIVNNARVSFSKTSQWVEINVDEDTDGPMLAWKDVKLIRYLHKHNHWVPFANGTNITFHVKAPIPIMRQLFKHKVGAVESEISRRYVDDEPEFFMPEWRHAAENVKQGSAGPHDMLGDDTLCDYTGESYGPDLAQQYEDYLNQGKALYASLVKADVCPEQARFLLPQAMYSEAIITHSLYGWANVVKLRTAPHAQVEVKELAEMISTQIQPLFPVAWTTLTSELD